MSDVVQRLVATGKWSEETAWLSERAGHRCEYCGLDLFASVANYKSFQVDHIVPVSKGGDPNSRDNKAVACRTCNFNLKSRWNPRDACTSDDRDALIAAVRAYIQGREQHYLKEVASMRAIAVGEQA
ncbi:MAG: HNH endonuclease [Deltaproteobacteria bacterium]|nr:HNH endonuclease [Deltaproteobacteria bacterium]